MKFNIHIFNTTTSRDGKYPLGLFEIYNENGEYVHGVTKRRVKNIYPEGHYEYKGTFLPLIILESRYYRKFKVISYEEPANNRIGGVYSDLVIKVENV